MADRNGMDVFGLKDKVFILVLYDKVSEKITGMELIELLEKICRQTPGVLFSSGFTLLDAIEAILSSQKMSAKERDFLRVVRAMYLGSVDGRVVPPTEMDKVFDYIVSNDCRYFPSEASANTAVPMEENEDESDI